MKTKKNTRIEIALFLESSKSTYEIKDQDGKTVSLDEARRRWEAGELDNWNMSFSRLAQHGFDLEATRAYYDREAARLKPAALSNPSGLAEQQAAKPKDSTK